MSRRPPGRRLTALIAFSVLAALAPASISQASAEGSWKASRVSTTADFFDVSFPTSSHGWAVGTAGSVLATADGGVTWQAQSSSTSAKLLGVDFISPTTGWAVGEGDTLLSTLDGGTTWSVSSTGSGASLEDVDFVDAAHGWAVGFTASGGQMILATSDGGQTWKRQLAPPDGIGLVDVSFFDRERGLAVGYLSRVYRTEDGGTTWLPVSFPTEPFDSFYSATWIDATTAVLSGFNGQIWRSENQGLTWTQQADLDGTVRSLAASGGSVFAVGSKGLVARSSDGGSTWATGASGTIADLYGIAAPAPTFAVAAGTFGFTTTFTGSSDGSRPAAAPMDLSSGTDACSQELTTRWKRDGAGVKVASLSHDFDRDGTPEVVVGGPDGVRALRPFASTTDATLWELALPARVQKISLAQLDADDDQELLIATAATSAARDGIVAFDPVQQQVLWSARLERGSMEVEPADLDGDGIDDVVALGNSVNHSLFVLSGIDGSELRPPRPLAGAPTDLEIGTLDHDGIPDIVVTTESPKVIALSGRLGSLLWTYTNDASAARLQAVELSDLDDDGLDDVVAAGYGAPRSATMGNGDNSISIGTTAGPFVAALDGGSGRILWDYADPGSGTMRSLALGDFSGDGTDDVVAHASTIETGHLIALDGRGRELAQQPTKEPRELWAFDTTRSGAGEQHVVFADGLSLADGNRDGILDVYVPLWHGSLFAISGKVPEQGQVTIKPPQAQQLWEERRGAMTYSASVIDSAGSASILSLSGDHLVTLRDAGTGESRWNFDSGGSSSLAPGDFNGDGSSDIAVANASGRAYALAGADAALLTADDHFWPQSLVGIAPVDVTEDGTDELAGASADGVVRVIDPRTGEALWETQLTGRARSLSAGSGLVVVGMTDGRVVALAEATGSETWSAGSASKSGVSSLVFSGANDSFAAGDGAGQLRILGDDGSLVGSGVAGGPIWDISPLDVNGDGNDEFAVAATSSFALFGPTGEISWNIPATRASEIAVGDLDGDALDDVVAVTNTGPAYGVNGASAAILWTVANGEPGGAATVDIDGDGTEEAVLASLDTAQVRVISGDGAVAATCSLASNPTDLASGDFDGDGFDETIVSTEQGDTYLLAPTADRTTPVEVTPTPRGTTTPPPPSERGIYPEAPNDPYFAAGKNLDPLGLTEYGDATAGLQWGPQKIRATQAWQVPRATGHGIKVAVLDSGVDVQHEDLACAGKIKIVPGSDTVAGDGDPNDQNGHGTHVAGIIGACTDNGVGVAGIAPDVTILPIRVLDAGGSGTISEIAAGIDSAAAAGAHVINMSLSFGPSSGTDLFDISAIDSAIEAAAAEGAVVIAAAGNSGFPLCEFPSLAADVICVGATDNRDNKSWYSGFANKVARGGPALVAPGGVGTVFCDLDSEDILSLFPPALATPGNCDGRVAYENMSGTSMAAPHVAGAAALVYDRLGGDRSTDHAQQVIGALTSTAVDLGPPGYDPVYGSGRVDALAAVCALGPSCDEETAPLVAPTGLSATPASPSQIDLAWSDNSDNEEGFKIERSTDAETWNEISSTEADATSYSDTGLEPETTYHYRVRAFNAYGDSDRSNIASATTESTSKPTTLAFTQGSDGAGQYSDLAALQARLSDDQDQSLEDREVTFELLRQDGGSAWSDSAVTDAEGQASVEITLTESPGTYTLTARYAGEADRYDESGASTSFEVHKEDTATTVDVQGKGAKRTLTAMLSDHDSGAGIEGRSIDFYGDGNHLGSATTDAGGNATIHVPPRYRGGNHDFEARFAGDDYYLGSSSDDPEAAPRGSETRGSGQDVRLIKGHSLTDCYACELVLSMFGVIGSSDHRIKKNFLM